MTARKIAVVASASGNGKTTLGRELAQRLRVPFVELDSLVHGPGWVETPDDELRARVEPILTSDGWVIDGAYERKLGNLGSRLGRSDRLARPAHPHLAAPARPPYLATRAQPRAAVERQYGIARLGGVGSRIA